MTHSQGDPPLRDYPIGAVQRLLEPQETAVVNGADVELRRATDLAPGHLDPWLVSFEESLRADTPQKAGLLPALRDLATLVVARDKVLLRSRATIDAAIARLQGTRDLTQGEVQVTRLEWNLAGEVRPVWRYERADPDDGPRPVFLHLHGGGFSAGTPTGRDPFLQLIADRAGAVVFDVDYSMIPERTFPQPVREACAALQHVRVHAEAWGLDASRIVVGGGSAGGNLAAATALAERDSGNPLALQVLYVPFLLFGGKQPGLSFTPVFVAPEHQALAGPQHDPIPTFLVRLLYRAYRGKGHLHDPYLSPAHCSDLRGVAPALIITGEMDPLHQSGEHYAGDLARAGVSVRTIRYCGVKHDSVAHVGYLPQAEAAALETVAAIRSLPSS